ncbi:MAG TPA: GNAT family N-acetyltransferase [Cyclobacteriaceae bacterium]|nr:GNAT family N-acetyltransferase [Cyclobacteriaceae bacterium]
MNALDLPRLHNLQPDGWMPIIPYYEFYVAARYCYPVKCLVDNRIVGIGNSIEHQGTAWLAHIIVHPDYRRQGIGTVITTTLMDRLTKERRMRSVHLVATPMGAPLYQQLGFIRVSDYVFLHGGKTSADPEVPIEICTPKLRNAGLEMDYNASSENRSALLEPHWNNACFITKDGALTGFYMPSLGEGYILAASQESGLALLRRKHSNGAPGVIPEENRHAIRYLETNGFSEYRRGVRMSYGEPLAWHPDRIYGRIGGNVG